VVKVIVTDGTGGIGAATVRAFVNEGAKVVIADFSERGKELPDQLNQQDFDTLFAKTDVTSEDQVKNLVDETVRKYGKLNIKFANASIAFVAGSILITDGGYTAI
jgi:Short-chain alcohol dehydrogenase of unknown specificity